MLYSSGIVASASIAALWRIFIMCWSRSSPSMIWTIINGIYRPCSCISGDKVWIFVWTTYFSADPWYLVPLTLKWIYNVVVLPNIFNLLYEYLFSVTGPLSKLSESFSRLTNVPLASQTALETMCSLAVHCQLFLDQTILQLACPMFCQ